jgi:hypothetical protein
MAVVGRADATSEEDFYVRWSGWVRQTAMFGHAPMDRELDVEKTDFSPGGRRMMG